MLAPPATATAFESLVTGLSRHAVESPEAIAAICGAESLTFGELDDRSKALASTLIARGIDREQIVGVFLPRSLDAVIALCGILRAGAAYLPLDPSYPAERIGFMLEDSQAVLVLTTSDLRSALSPEVPTLCLDALPPTPEVECVENRPHDLAYVIYTSGSTGKPKGVAIEHAAAMNTLRDINERFAITGGDRVLGISSLSFDLSVYDIFGMLAVGGTCVFPTAEETRDPLAWLRLIREHGITVWNSVPALAEMLTSAAEATDPRELASLEQVWMSGDWIPVSLPARLKQLRPGLEVISLGGATEASIWSIYYRVGEVDRAWKSVPYGYPLAGQTWHVLDGDGQPCPAGEPGELHIGGLGVAREYLNRRQLSSERFVRDAFATNNNGSPPRLYRTGDWGRFLPSEVVPPDELGNPAIEFLGRADTQVKINGYRIELAEIESVLERHPALRAAAVVAPREASGSRRLVAHVVPREGSLDGDALRQSLAAVLPGYMVPGTFVEHAALPLSSNGKVDRSALEQNVETCLVEDDAADSIESRVITVWQRVLKRQDVSPTSRFLALGGDSLRMVELMLAAMKEFGVSLPLNEPLSAVATPRDVAAMIRTADGTASEGIPATQATTGPASFQQQQLWSVEQLEPRSPAYHIASLHRIHGAFDIARFETAVTALIDRHEPFRTTFALVNGAVEQHVRLAAELARCIVVQPGTSNEAQCRAFCQQTANGLFDLAHDALLRAGIAPQDNGDTWLVLVMHHIASDGWTLGLVHRALTALYAEPSTAPHPVQLATSARYAASLAYWQTQLAGALPLTELAADHPRKTPRSWAGATHRVTLDRGLLQRLKTLAAAYETTLFTLLATAYHGLLARTSGQTEHIIGVPVAGRNDAELQDAIGYFVSVLALRMNAAPNATLTERIVAAGRTCSRAFAHADVPLVELAPRLSFDRSAGDQVPFRTMLVLHNWPITGLELGDAEELAIDTGTAKCDLILSATETVHGLECAWEYSTDLFEPERIARLTRQFEILLTAMLETSAATLDDIALVDDAEREQLLAWGNHGGTDSDYPTVVERFAEIVSQWPTAIACIDGDATWTYATLGAHADRVAAELANRGVRPGDRVGVLMDRSAGYIATILGVLKCGGVYVPLDKQYPQERLQTMVADAGVKLVVADSAMPLMADVEWVVGSAWSVERRGQGTGGGGQGGNRLARSQRDQRDVSIPTHGPRSTSAAPAYIMFTSGSTGRPKGVVVPHAGITRLVGETNFMRFAAGDVFLLLSPVSFDASTLEIFGPLLNGGTVAIAPPGSLTIGELGSLVKEHHVTALWLTAGLFHQVVDHGLEHLTGLKYLLAGGDVLSPTHTRRALEQLPTTTIINGYGPTENTTFTCCHGMHGGSELDASRCVPIGKPIAGTSVYLLEELPNRRHRLVPIGMPGELYTGGAGLAIEYANDANRTAERFVTVDLGDGQLTRLYRTGDLARWRSDGTLEYLGREDRQVKIRGFRIEPGEIEIAIGRHPQVRQAVVLPSRGAGTEKQLMAFVVIEPPRAANPRDDETLLRSLRTLLAKTLPAYMVPARWLVVPTLPLDAHGKVDRERLLALVERESVPAADEGPSRIPSRLARIWKLSLGVNRAEPHDDFFGLGGDSLIAMGLLAEVEREYGKRLSLSALITHPTLAGFAALLLEDRTGRDYLVPLREGDAAEPLFLLPCININLVALKNLALALDTRRAVIAVVPQGVEDGLAPQDDIGAMAEHYLAAIRTVQPQGPYRLAGYSLGGTVAYDIAQRLRFNGEQVAFLALLDSPAKERPRPIMVVKRVYRATLDAMLTAIGRKSDATVSEVDDELTRNAIVDAHLAALDRYHPQPYFGRMHVFRARDRSVMRLAIDNLNQDWHALRLVPPSTPLIWVPGTHGGMVKEPHLAVLAAELSAALETS